MAETRQYLLDLQEACRKLSAFTKGCTFQDYKSDDMMRSAVERQFEIIGEGLNQMLRHDPTVAGQITNWKKIIGFRNRLVHGYATIDDAVVWGVLEENLERLRLEVEHLLIDPGMR